GKPRRPTTRSDPIPRELIMEICILKFAETDDADTALKEVIDANADRYPWLHEAGVVKRPLLGRISIRATFTDDQAIEIKQGDLSSAAADAGAMTGYLVGSLVGPLHAEMAALEAGGRASSATKTLEGKLMRVDDIKEILPRGSSAIVLIA